MALATIPGLKFIVSCPFFCGAVLYLVDESQVILNLASPSSFSSGSTTSIAILSNRIASVSSGNDTSAKPVVETFLAAPQACWLLAAVVVVSNLLFVSATCAAF